MDNSDDKKSGNKYEDQIKLRKAKLEKMRKERQVLQLEKLKREKTTQEHLEDLRLKNEIRVKAKELNDTEIDKIQQEINKFNEDAKSTRSEVLDLKSSEKNIRSGTKTLTLKCSKMQITEIPPIETATYSKQTQTDISRIYKQNDGAGQPSEPDSKRKKRCPICHSKISRTSKQCCEKCKRYIEET